MAEELDAIKENHTWDLIPLPPGKELIGSKLKLKSDGVTKHALLLKVTTKNMVLTIWRLLPLLPI